VLVLVEVIELAVSTLDKEDRKPETTGAVELRPPLTELEGLLAVELPVVATAVTVDVGTVAEVETVVDVVGAGEDDDEEEDVVVVVVRVETPEEITEVVVDVTVGSGKVGRTKVVVKPSVTMTVLDCAEAAVRSAATVRMFLREGILLIAN
jgi:hypothetical protein